MKQNIETAANQAIFQMQLNTDRAVQYIQKTTGCTREVAESAVASVVTFHKK